MITGSNFTKCPACQTWYDPRSSAPACPHSSMAPESETLRKAREAGPPYVRESWNPAEPE
jgi:hypothetical protein